MIARENNHQNLAGVIVLKAVGFVINTWQAKVGRLNTYR